MAGVGSTGIAGIAANLFDPRALDRERVWLGGVWVGVDHRAAREVDDRKRIRAGRFERSIDLVETHEQQVTARDHDVGFGIAVFGQRPQI